MVQKNNNRANVTWRAHENNGMPLLLLVDLDQGGRSLTNDMNGTLTRIRPELPKPINSYRIAYRDSNGAWDWVTLAHTEVNLALRTTIHDGPRDGSLEAAWQAAGGQV